MGQRQHVHRGADLDALGARGDLRRRRSSARSAPSGAPAGGFRRARTRRAPSGRRPRPARSPGRTRRRRIAPPPAGETRDTSRTPWPLPSRSAVLQRLGRAPPSNKYCCLIRPIPAGHGKRVCLRRRIQQRCRDGAAQPALFRPHRRTRQHHPRRGASARRAAGADPPCPAARGRAQRRAVHPRQSRRAADRGRAEAARRRDPHPARRRAHRRRNPRPGRASQRQDHPRHHPDPVPGAGARAVRAHAPRLSDDRIEGHACRHGAARGIRHRRPGRHRAACPNCRAAG